MKSIPWTIYVLYQINVTSGKREQLYPSLVTVVTTNSEEALESHDKPHLRLEDDDPDEMRVFVQNSPERRKLVKQTPVDDIEPSVHQCVHYTRKVTKLYTLNDPPLRCVMCDPTSPFCNPLCQKWIDYQFAACRGVCLPDGFFFDAGICASITLHLYCIYEIV